jgi:ATP-binding cassette, subfamily F, member 3
MQQKYKKQSEQDLRNYLGQFGFHGDTVLEKVAPLSGGEKARLVLALLLYDAPNLLLLDEPTNHLDLDTRAALELALQSYQGAMVIISHDRHLLATTVDSFYLLAEKQIKAFDGDLDDYENWLLQTSKKKSNNEAPAKLSQPKRCKKTLNRIKKIENTLTALSQKRNAIEQTLADDKTYEDQNKMNQCLQEQQSIQTEINALEEEWILLQED